MTATWFVLDSLHADYAGVLAALHTATDAKYTGSVTQSIRDAGHNANIKLVKANITDAERTGSLATLARTEYGVSVYKDEYPTHTVKELEAFNLLGESGRVTRHCEAPYEPDGSWVWSQKATIGSGDGRTYGDRIVGHPTINGELSGIAAPATDKEDWFYHGFWIAPWRGAGAGRTIAAFAGMKLYNGNSPAEKFKYRFDHWLKPARITAGHVLQHENSWVKDGVTNAYSILEGSGSHHSENAGYSKFYDPDFDTLDFGGELTPVADLATCKATPGTFFFDIPTDTWWVYLADGGDPTGRVVGTGDFGFHLDFGGQLAAENVKENLEFFSLNGIMFDFSLKPNSAIQTMQHIRFNMLKLHFPAGDADGDLVHLWVQGTGSNTLVADIYIAVDQLSEAKNGIYIISQDGEADSGLFRDIIVEADVNARDGRENIFDIGKNAWEANTDNHAIGWQMIDGLIIRYLKCRRTGGCIVGYLRNWIHPLMNQINRPTKDILIHDNDVAEVSASWPGSGSGSMGIGLTSDNALIYPSSNIIVRDNNVLGYDANPAKAFNYCYRNTLPDQAIFEGNHGDRAAFGTILSGKAFTLKWIDLTGSTGNWNVDDFIEDNSAQGTKIGRIVKIESANPTIRLFYCHQTSQTSVAQDIADAVTINNQDDTGTGITNGTNSSRVLGSNTRIRASAKRRSRFGNSGGTVPWVSVNSGAPVGGSDPLNRLTGGWYLDEQNTDFVGLSDHLGFVLTGKADATLATYQADSDAGNVYGTGSVVVAT